MGVRLISMLFKGQSHKYCVFFLGGLKIVLFVGACGFNVKIFYPESTVITWNLNNVPDFFLSGWVLSKLLPIGL
jgi:hypothetical protein